MKAMSPEFWSFVAENSSADPFKLRLKYHGCDNIDLAITQIECRKKYAKKLPDTLRRDNWLFPDALSGEQCTSDILADYHATLMSRGDRVADLTAGLGIDCVHISAIASEVVAVEINADKAKALDYNLIEDNVRVICADCRDFVKSYDGERFDAAFIDPARRAADGGRVFSLSECAPDVVSMIPDIQRIARRLIVKMSPMLDITHAAGLLPGLERIIALGTTTECKELVAIVDLDNIPESYRVEAVTISSEGAVSGFGFLPSDNSSSSPQFVVPETGDYLYVPYPAVMKAAPFNILSCAYHAPLLHPNTHLFVSKDPILDFPGQVLRIVEAMPYCSSVLKRLSKEYKMLNVTARNFSLTAEAIRKKLKVKDGGDKRLFAVTCSDGKEYLLLAVPL